MQFLDRRQLEHLSGLDPDIENRFRQLISGREGGRGPKNTFRPPADMMLENDRIVILVELAGIQRDSIHLGLGENELVLYGEREEPRKLDIESYVDMELNFGPFERRFRLPAGADTEHVDANYSDGFLTITMPLNRESRSLSVKEGK
jgi:HSP20 family protein